MQDAVDQATAAMTNIDETRVFLIEEHEMIRRGQHAVLSSATDITVVGDVGSSTDALRLIPNSRADVVIVGGSCRRDGVEIVRRIVSGETGSADVIVLAEGDTEDELVGAINAGVSAVLPRNCSDSDLLSAVHAVARSAAFLPPDTLRRLFRVIRDRAVAPEPDGAGLSQLTRRERQVAGIVAQGHSNSQIARQLQLSEKTIEGHLSRIYSKLGIVSRAALASVVTRGVLRLTGHEVDAPVGLAL